jgi:hypothetical protein
MLAPSLTTRALAAAFALAGLAVIASGPQAAADEVMSKAGAKVVHETKTAAEHAQYAAESSELKMVHTHLHHTINCLVGPGGEGFDGGFANPCADQGKGAIPDATDESMKEELETALSLAKSGLMANDVKAAQAAANQAAAILNKQVL